MNSTHAKIIASTAIVAALLSGPVNAEVSSKSVAACAAIDGAVERLQCFDSLAEKHSLAPHTKTIETTAGGAWSISEKIDPLTDKSIHFAMLKATSGASKWGRPVTMMVRCKDNVTDMYINWGSYLGRDARTTFRVDRETAQKSGWSLSTDSTAAFHPGSPIPLLKRIATASTFVASVTPYNDSPITAVFDVAGAGAAFSGIRTSCGW